MSEIDDNNIKSINKNFRERVKEDIAGLANIERVLLGGIDNVLIRSKLLREGHSNNNVLRKEVQHHVREVERIVHAIRYDLLQLAHKLEEEYNEY